MKLIKSRKSFGNYSAHCTKCLRTTIHTYNKMQEPVCLECGDVVESDVKSYHELIDA